MNFSALVKSRLAALGYGQKDLARAARVSDSYISQLLTQKKAPPAGDRTDIYKRLEAFLELEPGRLARIVEIERTEELRRKLSRVPEPLFQEFRALVLRKCVEGKRDDVRAIFDAQPFGTLERMVARALLDLVQRIAREELDSENWIRLAASVGDRSREEMRVIALEFLNADVLHVSRQNCVAFLDPLVEGWNVDLGTLRLDILLNPRLVRNPHRTFMFVEAEPADDSVSQAALAAFLDDPPCDIQVTEAEIRLLRHHRFGGKRPTELYYYRALQNLRDPLHFYEA